MSLPDLELLDSQYPEYRDELQELSEYCSREGFDGFIDALALMSGMDDLASSRMMLLLNRLHEDGHLEVGSMLRDRSGELLKHTFNGNADGKWPSKVRGNDGTMLRTRTLTETGVFTPTCRFR